ncbi:MAG TPA: hypothetical protein VF516_41755 [Kofleriaceae bacterium]
MAAGARRKAACELLGTNPVGNPPDTMHFYSPISMGKKQPAWAKDSAEVHVDGISKERFRFFHGVK